MNQATTPTAPPLLEARSGRGAPVDPPGTLMSLIAAFLAPMFLGVSGGDVGLARTAAVETLNAYCARNNADLIAIAQIIACGLTALGSLSHSTADNLSLSMTLRLRANAVALNRVAEQNRRALRAPAPEDVAPHPLWGTEAGPTPFATGSDDAPFEAQVVSDVAAAQTLSAEAQARLRNSKPADSQASVPVPSSVGIASLGVAQPDIAPAGVCPMAITLTELPPAGIGPVAAAALPPEVSTASPSAVSPAMTAHQQQAMWASAMTEVAGEFTAGLRNLPPTERKLASRRAQALSSCANQLLLGDVSPRLRPGDLAALIAERR